MQIKQQCGKHLEQRRNARARDDLIRFSSQVKSVVIWNITRECNLQCKHCYINVQKGPHTEELTLGGNSLHRRISGNGDTHDHIRRGEPFASENFFLFAFYAKAKKCAPRFQPMAH
ncbi:MAG: hypothetical protein QXL78_03985 [Methanocellales archaeon]